MGRPARLPIRRRLTFAAAMAVVLVAAGLFLYLRLGAALDRTIDRSLPGRADNVTALVRAAGSGLRQAPSSRLVEQEALESLLRQLLLGGPIVLVVASLLGYGLAAAALRPVESMRRETEAGSATAPGRRLPSHQATTRSSGSGPPSTPCWTAGGGAGPGTTLRLRRQPRAPYSAGGAPHRTGAGPSPTPPAMDPAPGSASPSSRSSPTPTAAPPAQPTGAQERTCGSSCPTTPRTTGRIGESPRCSQRPLRKVGYPLTG